MKQKESPITIRINITDKEFNCIANSAHDLDVSINEWVKIIIKEVIDEK
jgi:predicted HicB family RNase H-like nuclease